MTKRLTSAAAKVLRPLVAAGACAAVVLLGMAAHAQTTIYEYDELARLTGVDYSDGTATDFVFDAAGNRTSVVTTAPPPSPGTLSLSQSSYTVNEAGASATIAVTRTGGSLGTVGITYQATAGTASAGSDFATTSGTLSWTNGDASNKTFQVTIFQDGLFEGSETINLSLTNATGGPALNITAATLTIIDDENPPIGTLQLNASTYSIAETAGSVSITATRTGGSFGAASISYATGNPATATSGSDFASTSGALNWADGDSASKTFSVPITNDSLVEVDETFTVTLSGATGAGAGSPLSAIVTIVSEDIDVNPPSAPGTPTFSSITGTTATATWAAASDNVGVTGYRYSFNGGASWTNVSSSPASLTNLSTYTAYSMIVQARDAQGNWGPSSNSGSFTTLDVTPPTAPGALSFTNITTTTATLNWGASTDNAGIAYYVYRLNNGGWIYGSTGTSANASGLTACTQYNVEIYALDVNANIGPSTFGSFTTTDTCPPTAPGTPSITNITETTATASWPASSDGGGIDHYEYRLIPQSGGPPRYVSVAGNVTSANLSNLVPGWAHWFLVTAYDPSGNYSPVSTEVQFFTPDNTPPTAPGAITFSDITMSGATASWGPATDNSGICFSYYWRVDGGAWNFVGSQTSASISGLSPGTTYAFEVHAEDCKNNIGPSNSSQFTTSAPTWITVANGVQVIPPHNQYYNCWDEIDYSVPYIKQWCYGPPGLVAYYENSVGGEILWNAEGYQGFLQVRSDYYPQ